MTTRHVLWCAPMLAAALNVACGDSAPALNLVGPSAVVAPGAQQDTAGGGIVTVAGGRQGTSGSGGGNGNSDSGKPPSNTSPTTVRRIEVEGVISAKGATTVTVNAQLITVPASAVIRHGSTFFTFADLQVGDRVHIKGASTTTGAGATSVTTTEASEVKLQREDDDSDDEGPSGTSSGG